MRHGSLFSGIGGFDLASAGMGWDNIFYCEKDGFCRKVLNYYWPRVDSHGDISQFDATKYRGKVDILTGGFPCQPFSAAGDRRGQRDHRYLWPQALRIIKQVQPRWFVFENVAGLLSILEPANLSEMEIKTAELFGKDQSKKPNGIFRRIQRRIIATILSDIRSAGYLLPALKDGTPVILCIPACAINAPHRRDRIWIVAYADLPGLERRQEASDPERKGPQENEHFTRLFGGDNWADWTAESPFDSQDDGISPGLDGITFSKFRRESLKSYGNAVVPQVVFQIFQAIEKTEQLDFKAFYKSD